MVILERSAYLNGYVEPPLLSGFVEQGMSLGAAMAAVWPLVHRNVFAAYLGLGPVGAVISGILFQLFV